ncbi:MAG: efflux RND transporter periplasmic adaptor subunit [Thiomonas sp.]|nr:efflux RND transporter periplasmic adaptor subunit [Thiomonas sp.]
MTAAPARAALPQAVVWSAAQQTTANLQIQRLAPAAYHPQFTASATVQSPAGLLRGLSAQDAAQAQLAVAQSRLQLATLKAQRAKGLFDAGQNVALAEVQQAQAAAAQAQAEVGSGQAALGLAQAQLTATLGPALAARLRRDAQLRQSILSGRTLVVDLSLPPGKALPPAAQIWLQLPDGHRRVQARVIGPAAAASSQFQGVRNVLVAPAADGMMPGMELQAEVQSTQTLSGVRLPASAVVWAAGQAVVFVATPAAHQALQFAPRAVSTAWPLQGDYVQPGWTALDVVTRGAGLVLTPPPSPHAAPASGGDDD